MGTGWQTIVSAIRERNGRTVVLRRLTVGCEVYACADQARRTAKIPLGHGHVMTLHVCLRHAEAILREAK